MLGLFEFYAFPQQRQPQVMNQIQPFPLWLGSIGDLRDVRRLYEVEIRAVVQLAHEEALVSLPRDFIVCRVPLVDGPENDADLLRLAVDTVTRLLQGKFATLVCCQAGASRSPAIAAAALARLTDDPFMVCVDRIRKCRPVDIHAGLLAHLCRLFETEPTDTP